VPTDTPRSPRDIPKSPGFTIVITDDESADKIERSRIERASIRSTQRTRFRRRFSRRQRRSQDRLRLLPIGWALTICFTAAALGLAGLSWVALALLHHPKLPTGSSISLHDLVSVLQLVFASVAGAGALVALVMTYRRQRVAEVTTAHDRIRVLNERFTAISAQLGDDSAAIR
jgi:hypothetical protein